MHSEGGGRFSISSLAGAGLLGDLIAGGRHTPGEIRSAAAEAGGDIFILAGLIQNLFDRGMLDEEP